MEVEHVEAHLTKKEKENMSQFEKFVPEGNEKADDLVKTGAMLVEDLWHKRKQKLCSRKERMCSQPCSMRRVFTA